MSAQPRLRIGWLVIAVDVSSRDRTHALSAWHMVVGVRQAVWELQELGDGDEAGTPATGPVLGEMPEAGPRMSSDEEQ